MFVLENSNYCSFSVGMSGSRSCHLDRVSNVEIGFECQMFASVLFFNCSQVSQFGAFSKYYKGALTQKRSVLVICTTVRYLIFVSAEKIKTTIQH